MSLILEALRKSEAERRRGSAPDVAMELPPVAAARVRPLPAWLLPVAVAAAIGLGAAWWWSQRDAAAAPEPGPAAAVPVAAPRIETPSPAIATTQPAPPAMPATRPAPIPAAKVPPPATRAEPVTAPMPPMPPAIGGREVPDIDASGLPPVKLSMHMWDEAPGKRFVILDGQRMAEGDRSGGLTVVAIERDGVVIERDGQRARVPLP